MPWSKWKSGGKKDREEGGLLDFFYFWSVGGINQPGILKFLKKRGFREAKQSMPTAKSKTVKKTELRFMLMLHVNSFHAHVKYVSLLAETLESRIPTAL